MRSTTGRRSRWRSSLPFLVLVGLLRGVVPELSPLARRFLPALPLKAARDVMWVKDISSQGHHRRDKIVLTCPAGHVIYDPHFRLAASEGREKRMRRDSSRDCQGMTHNTQAQVNKCFWQRGCELEWRGAMAIETSLNSSCVGTLPSYVVFDNPLCVPESNVITICDTYDIVSADFGILRSHDTFPWRRKRVNVSMACRKTFIVKPNHSLFMTADYFSATSPDRVIIFHVTSKGSSVLSDVWTPRDVMFSVTSGRVIVDFVIGMTRKADVTSGFILKFEQKPCHYQSDDVTIGQPAVRLASFGYSSFQARATITRCLSHFREEITLTCPQDNHVLFGPEVRHGTSSSGAAWWAGCHGEARTEDCRGQTHTLLSQLNKCHWRHSCRLAWNNQEPIIVTVPDSCRGRMPQNVQLIGAQCLASDAIFDMCDPTIKEIRTTDGYLRSHADYPWNYDDQPLVCRKRICAHRKFGLRISSRNLDLSPNPGGDYLKLWSVSKDNGRGEPRVFRGQQTVEGCFTSGCVDVEFRRKPGENRGRGFVLRLETLEPVSDNSSDYFTCGQPLHTAGTLEGQDTYLMHGPCEVTATQLEKTPFKAHCKNGVISSISVRGHSGPRCQGLTPDLFVQVNSCFWKSSCTLTYSTNRTNYMLKLYKGDITECVTKQAEHFTISYECTKKGNQLQFVREPRRALEKKEVKEVEKKKGVLLSHSQHPWLYARHNSHRYPHGIRQSISLRRPKKQNVLQYTIRTLDLMAGDNLTVNWTEDGVTWSDRSFHAYHDLEGVVNNTFTLTAADNSSAVFSLVTSRYTNGGEGFVICFRWLKRAKKLSDTCKKMMIEQGCGGKGGGKRGGKGCGGKGGEKGGGKGGGGKGGGGKRGGKGGGKGGGGKGGGGKGRGKGGRCKNKKERKKRARH